MKLTKEYCGYFLNAFEMGLRFEGADTYFQQLYEKFTTPEMLDTYSTYTRSFVRDLKRIHKILTEEDITERPIEQTRGYIFFRTLGSELGLIRFNKTTLDNLYSDLIENLMTLGKNRFFDVTSLPPVGVRAQTPMGVMMFNDMSLLTMTSIHTDEAIDTITTTKNLLLAKHVTLRYTLKT